MTAAMWSLYFKTIHGTLKMWPHMGGYPKMNIGSCTQKPNSGTKGNGLIIKVVS